MTVDEIGPTLERVYRGLALVSNRAYKLSRSPFFFFFLHRKRLMALSDDINAITVTVNNIAEQAPPAIAEAIANAAASGGDPAAPGAVANLSAAVANLTTGLQTAIGGNATV